MIEPRQDRPESKRLKRCVRCTRGREPLPDGRARMAVVSKGRLCEGHGPGGSRNYGDYGSAELDAMLDEQRGIYDQEERREKVYEIQRYIINNPGPAWIGSRIGFGVQTAKMRNVRAHPFLAGYDDAENVWLKA